MGSEVSQFKSGQSGNPGGRPKTKFLTEFLVQALLEPWADGRPAYQHLVEQMILNAEQGNSVLAKEIFERVEGKVPAGVSTPEFKLSEAVAEAGRIYREHRAAERPVGRDRGRDQPGRGDAGGLP